MINSFGLYVDGQSDDVKRYVVESRKSYSDIFDNYVYDYIYAEMKLPQSKRISHCWR